MNGELTVNSTPGEGSVFEFTMSLGLAPEAKCSGTCCVSPDDSTIKCGSSLRGARIILVDTHPVRQVRYYFHFVFDCLHQRLRQWLCTLILTC